MRKLATLFVTSAGVGFIPLAPGTWGAVIGLLIVLLAEQLSAPSGVTVLLIVLSLLFSFLARWFFNFLGQDWKKDDQRIVMDETIGMLITLVAIPLTVFNLLLGFLLFRLFDIFKPLGIRRIDRMKSRWSVILDDVLAGIYGNISLQILLFLQWI